MSEWSRRDASDPPSPRLRRARHRWENREVERSVWESDVEGKTARVAASELGKERVSNGREHMSQFQSSSVGVFRFPQLRGWTLGLKRLFLRSASFILLP